jgi:hypothetical protein
MYTAESIIRELKAKDGLAYEGIDNIRCPNNDPAVLCKAIPDCEEGKEQDCKQHIKIFRDYKLLLVLTVRFKISPSRDEGFIRKGDSDLKKLFVRDYLDKTLLQSA